MKHQFIKSFSMHAALTLLVMLLTATTARATVVDGGNCGNGVGWKLDSEGTFTIYGNGSMYDYGNTGVPWYSYRNDIHTVVIEDGVTTIGNNAFNNTAWYDNQPDGLVYAGKVAYKYKGTMPEGTAIEILEGTLGIADNAFDGCTSLTSVTIPNSVTNIGNDAFYE